MILFLAPLELGAGAVRSSFGIVFIRKLQVELECPHPSSTWSLCSIPF